MHGVEEGIRCQCVSSDWPEVHVIEFVDFAPTYDVI